MADIKLTDATWLEYNTERVRGALKAMLGKTDKETGERLQIAQATLKRELERVGLKFTIADLVIIRDTLIVDGFIVDAAMETQETLALSQPEILSAASPVEPDVAPPVEPDVAPSDSRTRWSGVQRIWSKLTGREP